MRFKDLFLHLKTVEANQARRWLENLRGAAVG